MIIYKNKKLIVPNGLGLNTDGIIPSDEYATKEYVNTKVDGLAGNVYSKEEVDDKLSEVSGRKLFIKEGDVISEEDYEDIIANKVDVYALSTLNNSKLPRQYKHCDIQRIGTTEEKTNALTFFAYLRYTPAGQYPQASYQEVVITFKKVVEGREIVYKANEDVTLTYTQYYFGILSEGATGTLTEEQYETLFDPYGTWGKGRFELIVKTSSSKLIRMFRYGHISYVCDYLEENSNAFQRYVFEVNPNTKEYTFTNNRVEFYTKEESDVKYALKGEGGVEGIQLTDGLILTAEQYENIITGKANAYIRVVTGRTEEWAIADIKIVNKTSYFARVRTLLTNHTNIENTEYTLVDSEASFELQEDGTYKCAITETKKGAVKDIILPYSNTSNIEITKELYDSINANYVQNIFLHSVYGNNVALAAKVTDIGKEVYTLFHNQTDNKNYLLKVLAYKDEDEKYYTEAEWADINYVYHLDSMSQEELVALYNLIKASTLAEIAKMNITFEDTDNDTLYRATSIKRHTDYIDFASNNEGQLIAVSLNSDGTLS